MAAQRREPEVIEQTAQRLGLVVGSTRLGKALRRLAGARVAAPAEVVDAEDRSTRACRAPAPDRRSRATSRCAAPARRRRDGAPEMPPSAATTGAPGVADQPPGHARAGERVAVMQDERRRELEHALAHAGVSRRSTCDRRCCSSRASACFTDPAACLQGLPLDRPPGRARTATATPAHPRRRSRCRRLDRSLDHLPAVARSQELAPCRLADSAVAPASKGLSLSRSR